MLLHLFPVKRNHIKFLRPTEKKTGKKKHRIMDAQRSSIMYQPDVGVEKYLYAPVYAGGRVLAASMLDAILFECFYNSAVLDIFYLMCGVRHQVSFYLPPNSMLLDERVII